MVRRHGCHSWKLLDHRPGEHGPGGLVDEVVGVHPQRDPVVGPKRVEQMCASCDGVSASGIATAVDRRQPEADSEVELMVLLRPSVKSGLVSDP